MTNISFPQVDDIGQKAYTEMKGKDTIFRDTTQKVGYEQTKFIPYRLESSEIPSTFAFLIIKL